jgi:hypothetical protein
MINWTTTNSKLVKTGNGKYKVLGYGIQADYDFLVNGLHSNTCPGAKECRGLCYAKQGTYNFRNVKNNRIANIHSSLEQNFVELASVDLQKFVKRNYNVCRVHDSGDFYNREYLDKWYEIAANTPSMLFYAYTKSLHLDPYKNKPSNFNLIQSLGGKWDSMVDLQKPHSRIFNTHQSRENAGYIDGNIDDMPAINGEVKIGLVYHGNKKLTPGQDKHFSFNIIQG